MSETAENTLRIARVPIRSASIGAVLLAICIVRGLVNQGDFYRSYLIAYLFWLGITLGCLAILMMQHVTGGNWGLIIRRILEASSRTLPLMAIAAVPLLAGMKTLYAWSLPGQTDPVIIAKHFYLNPAFFTERMIFYFVCWFALTYLLNKWSSEEDSVGASASLAVRMEGLSGAGLVLYLLLITFASIDWVMSLEPQWYSTIYGLLFMIGQALAGMAFTIAILVWLSDREPLSGCLKPAYLQDLGNLLLAFVMLWAYLEFSQFLIIWGENLNQEIPWYLRRMQGLWGRIGLTLVLLNFALPFVLLLFRDVKRRTRAILPVALLVLLMRLVDMFWMVLPAFGGGNAHVSWMNIVLPVGMGGLWFAYFAWQLQRMPILPVNDPRLRGVAEHALEHG